MTTFLMLVGVVASGKSTYADSKREEGWCVISSDEIRKELYGKEEIQGDPKIVFKIAHDRILWQLANGYNVVFDATNLTYKNRKAILDKIPSSVEKICNIIITPYDDLLKNNKKRSRQVPEKVIWEQIKKFEVPVLTEGFSDINICRSFASFDFLNDCLHKSFSFNQDNSHHTLTLGKHMEAAANYLIEKNRSDLAVAATFHDIGKLYTKTFNDYKGNKTKEAHYYKHNNVGAYLFLTDFGANLYDAQLICYHMQPFFCKEDKTKERWEKRLGKDLWSDILILHEADVAAH